jgi:multiple sugar transport system permease protein
VSGRRGNWLATILLAMAAVIFLAPLAWMLSTAFKPEKEIFAPAVRWIPQHPSLENFAALSGKAAEAPMGRWLLNSTFVTTSVVLLVLLISSMAAYALSRLRFKGRDALFFVILAAMLVPGQVTLIPVFLMIQKLGWFDTYQALIVPGLAGPFGVFMLRQFMLTIPKELEEAAVVDGCGPWRIWAQVILPLTRPALATLAVLTFLGSWNDFMWPLIATNSLEMRTVPVGITVFQGRYTTEYGLMMASAIVASLPVVVAFLLLQRFIIRGIVLTGLKG